MVVQGTTASVYLTKKAFRYFANDSKKWGDLVRGIYHEFMHIENAYGLYDKPRIITSHQDEIIAHYFTFTAVGLPGMTDRFKSFQIRATNDYYRQLYKIDKNEALSVLTKLLYVNSQCPSEPKRK